MYSRCDRSDQSRKGLGIYSIFRSLFSLLKFSFLTLMLMTFSLMTFSLSAQTKEATTAQDDLFSNLRSDPPKAGAVILHLATPLPSSQSVYITGNHLTLGNWDPSRVAMTRIDDLTFFHSFDGSMPETAEFKITLGSWDREMLINGKKGANQSYSKEPKIYEYYNVVFSEGETPKATPSVGNIKHYRGEDANGKIQERDFWVWTPTAYNSDTEYALLIMHDGQNLIDPTLSNYGVEWRVDETADSLQSGNYVRPFIVLGINNTSDRHREYMGELNTPYIDWILNQAIPAIRKDFTISKKTDDIISGGSSAGGAISFVLHTQYRDRIGAAICMSPALVYKGFDSLTPFVDGPKKDIRLYVDNGGLELELVLQPAIDFLLQNLENKGYTNPEDYIYISEPKAKHFESSWAQRLPEAIKYVLAP